LAELERDLEDKTNYYEETIKEINTMNEE